MQNKNKKKKKETDNDNNNNNTKQTKAEDGSTGGFSWRGYEALAMVLTGDCRGSSGGCKSTARPDPVVL